MMEIRVVDADKVRHLKARAMKLMESPLNHWCGAMVKIVLTELDLWEEKAPEPTKAIRDTNNITRPL